MQTSGSRHPLSGTCSMYRPFVRRRHEFRDVSWRCVLWSVGCWCLLSCRCSQAFVPAVSRSIRNSLYFSLYRSKRPWALQKDAPVQPSSLGSSLYMAAPNTDVKTEPDWTSNDPYRILCLSRSATLSDKDIKRAYRRLAMQYHPDVATTRDSTAEEKRVAADRFAKINAAYNRLLENKDAPSRESTASVGWQPPHRRSGSTANSSGRTQSKSDSFSTDWRDFMPKTNADEVYDAGGDSFGKIFSDLLQGASAVAGAAGSGGGVFRDFVEFLEQNVDGYGRNMGDNDSELAFLLQTGSMQEIADEMDETELVVQQLSSKLDKVQNEFVQVQAELAVTDRRYSETLELRERSDELQAQKGVVENYLKRARVRLSKLQVRYKELIVSGGGSSASRRQNVGSESTARSSASSFKEPATESPGARKQDSTTSPDEAWKEEGFGSFGGRSRGSSRRRSQQVQSPPSSSNDRATASYDSTQRSSTKEPSANRREVRSPSKNMQESSVSSIDDVRTNVPPHRRNSSQKSFERTIEEEKRRLRDIKVDEAFDQLKRDLGL